MPPLLRTQSKSDWGKATHQSDVTLGHMIRAERNISTRVMAESHDYAADLCVTSNLVTSATTITVSGRFSELDDWQGFSVDY